MKYISGEYISQKKGKAKSNLPEKKKIFMH